MYQNPLRVHLSPRVLFAPVSRTHPNPPGYGHTSLHFGGSASEADQGAPVGRRRGRAWLTGNLPAAHGELPATHLCPYSPHWTNFTTGEAVTSRNGNTDGNFHNTDGN